MNVPTSISLNARPVIDLEFSHFEATVGNIHVVGTWLMDPHDDGVSDPCLALIDATQAIDRVIPCIIPLEQAWLWMVEIGDPDHVWRTITEWMREGALPGNPLNNRDLWAVFDAVQSRLRDMIAMPPMPVGQAIKYKSTPSTVGLIAVSDADGVVLHETELTAHVRH